MPPSFDASVFINCPFDEQYQPLLRALLFTVRRLGLEPRIASESLDSGRPRLGKILDLIRACRFAVHDLSRIRAEEPGDFQRMNMPFELGLDIGCRNYGAGKLRRKCCLILESEKYRFQRAISDISNCDIGSHENKPELLVSRVRNWLVTESLGRGPSASEIWYDYNMFWDYLRRRLAAERFTDSEIQALPIPEFVEHLDAWLRAR